MEQTAHPALERFVDKLMLLHPRLALEGGGNHRGGVMIAVTGEVANGHHRVGDALLDQPLDLTGIHRHERPPDALLSGQASHVVCTQLCAEHSRKTIWERSILSVLFRRFVAQRPARST